MTTGRRSVWFWTAVAVAAAFTCVTAYDGNLAGAYCAARPRGCCPGRQDDCSVPILGTLCYCDDFCNHTSTDCCPDYLSFCKGIVLPPTPIKQCYTNGQYFKFGEIVKSNCNECRCEEKNGKLLTNCSSDECLIDSQILNTLKNKGRQFGWSAGNYSEFWGKTYDAGLTKRLGALISKQKILKMKPMKAAFQRDSLPRSYDTREIRGRRVSQPVDQGWCGSSWAITTVQVTADRFSVMSKGAINDELSVQHLLSCNVLNQEGCDGGHLTRAWIWIQKNGLVTENCYPWEGEVSKCRVSKKKTELNAKCPSSTKSNNVTSSRLHRVSPVYRVATETGIMHEIMSSGSVQAVMKVSKEFFMYKSGVYRCINLNSRSKTGYHSVRIVGWGEEYQHGEIVKFWIVSNSWGRWWGEGGYFRIRKGTNECQIEDFVLGAWASIEDFNLTSYSPPSPPSQQAYDNMFLKNRYNTNRV